jgi:hypothetical protein
MCGGLQPGKPAAARLCLTGFGSANEVIEQSTQRETKPMRNYWLWLFWVLTLAMNGEAIADNSEKTKTPADCPGSRFYTFSWPTIKECGFVPRGGTSTGTAITLDTQPHPGWLALQDPQLTAFERDRQAILAMAGPYRATFDFLETIGYVPGFKPDKPYQSWGTEYVYVVENKKDFISLQHIMVMFFQQGNEVHGPMVMKHWRQDWQYEKRDLLSYVGHNRWQRQTLPRNEVKGTWAQAVYQVDDSPRYESYGRWEHNANVSTWQSQLTWRPLPRREHSVRSDYQVLEGYNRHTILPDGWVQEEENYKLKLTEKGEPVSDTPYLSKELGINRYQRIKDFDFSAGDTYWEKTGDFWRVVREEWQAIIREKKTFRLREEVDGQALFMLFFEYAETSEGNSAKAIREFVRQTLVAYLADHVEISTD